MSIYIREIEEFSQHNIEIAYDVDASLKQMIPLYSSDLISWYKEYNNPNKTYINSLAALYEKKKSDGEEYYE